MIGLEDQRVLDRYRTFRVGSGFKSRPKPTPLVARSAPRNTFASVMIVAAASRELINNETDDPILRILMEYLDNKVTA